MRLALSCIAAAVALMATPAAAMDANVVDGVFTGGYTCSQGMTYLELTLDGDSDGFVRGTFRFNSATWAGGENRSVPEGKYAVSGRLDDQGRIVLHGDHWIQQPADYVMVDLAGTVRRQGSSLVAEGGVVGAPGCTTFRVVRN